MKIDLTQFRQTVVQESAEHIASMEAGLLRLRSARADVELLNAIFRSAHSIKGAAGTFGMANLVRFTHSIESLLDRMRSMEVIAGDEVIGTLLRSIDVLRDLLESEASPQPSAAMPADGLELITRIEALMSEKASAPHWEQQLASSPVEDSRSLNLYKIEFRPDRELFMSGTNPIVLLRNLAALGAVSCCHIHDDDLPALADLDPSSCYLSWTMELASECTGAELREIFEFVEHLAEIRIQCVHAPLPRNDAPASYNEPTAPQNLAAPAAPLKPAAVGSKPSTNTPALNGESTSIRVAIDKVDRLIDLVGELVIAHVMTAQMVDEFEPALLPKLREAVGAMERNTRKLHEQVMGIRMLPVGTLFQRYSRTVYDIAHDSGKQIRLETNGEGTEIDRGMLELLGDPLTHLARNAADHGIEAPPVRLAAGKPEEGLISLRAFHRSGKIVIEISDDGGGIDTDQVRRKAIERGLMGPDARLSDEQLRNLIFEPGFSTREQVTNLSGRGVGMDVVKRNVQQLNGTVALASEKGRGTTVTIELPLTLAILEGLLVRVSDRTLVLPLLAVRETVPLPDDKIARFSELGETVIIRGESVPLLRLSRFLGLTSEISNGENPAEENGNRRLAVIVESGRRKIGLVVDELLGQQQVVVKSLEKNLRKVEGLMGATILGDGHVAPIVDVAGIGGLDLLALQAPIPGSRLVELQQVSRGGLIRRKERGTADELV